ncbi:ADP-ribosylation factor 1 [Tanacetum coccineum]
MDCSRQTHVYSQEMNIGYPTFEYLLLDPRHEEDIEHGLYNWDRDPDRLLDAKNRLDDMLNEDVMRDGVLLVLANRHDLPDVMNVSEITDKLGLQFIQNRPWHILSTCATSGEGLYEGLDWLYSNIANKLWRFHIVKTSRLKGIRMESGDNRSKIDRLDVRDAHIDARDD